MMAHDYEKWQEIENRFREISVKYNDPSFSIEFDSGKGAFETSEYKESSKSKYKSWKRHLCDVGVTSDSSINEEYCFTANPYIAMGDIRHPEGGTAQFIDEFCEVAKDAGGFVPLYFKSLLQEEGGFRMQPRDPLSTWLSILHRIGAFVDLQHYWKVPASNKAGRRGLKEPIKASLIAIDFCGLANKEHALALPNESGRDEEFWKNSLSLESDSPNGGYRELKRNALLKAGAQASLEIKVTEIAKLSEIIKGCLKEIEAIRVSWKCAQGFFREGKKDSFEVLKNLIVTSCLRKLRLELKNSEDLLRKYSPVLNEASGAEECLIAGNPESCWAMSIHRLTATFLCKIRDEVCFAEGGNIAMLSNYYWQVPADEHDSELCEKHWGAVGDTINSLPKFDHNAIVAKVAQEKARAIIILEKESLEEVQEALKVQGEYRAIQVVTAPVSKPDDENFVVVGKKKIETEAETEHRNRTSKKEKRKSRLRWDGEASGCADAYIELCNSNDSQGLEGFCIDYATENKTKCTSKTLEKKLGQHRDEWDPERKYFRVTAQKEK